MDTIPDEFCLTVLRKFQTNPDVLFNITPFVSHRFKRLSYDSSLWKKFCIPGHWHLKKAAHFLQFHPVASTIQELTCCKHVLNDLKNLPIALSNVKKLSVRKEGKDDCWYCPGLCYMYSYAENIPALCPNLQCLEVPGDFKCGRECVEQLQEELPQLEVRYSDQIMHSETLLCPAVNKERLILIGETIEELVRNSKQHVPLNTAITFYNGRLDGSRALCNVVALGEAMLEIHFRCDLSLIEVKTISESCPKLTLLELQSCQRANSPSSLKTMIHLKEVKLNICTMPSKDVMAIIKASPSLLSLSILASGNVSAPASCSLPCSLRSLTLCNNSFDLETTALKTHGFFHCLLQGAQKCTALAYIKLRPISFFCKARKWLSVKAWPQLGEASLYGNGIPALLLKLADERAQITKLDLSPCKYSIEDFQAIGLFSSLRELELSGSRSSREDYPTSRMALLATECPVLESIGIVIAANGEQEDKTNPTLANVMPLMTALNSFEYLKCFSLVVSSDCHGYWVPKKDISDWQKGLNAAFEPWRLHSVDLHNLWFKQCPPAYRFDNSVTYV